MVPIPTANSAGNNQRGANGASSSATASTSSAKSSVQKYLTNCKSLYSCIYCRTHLANHDELVSRSFQGNHGRAYLFNSVINISCGPAVQRELNTGSHAVADIFCGNCETTLGWKYEKAYVETQKYKEGKYIIELAHVVRENRHLELDKGEIFFGAGNGGSCRLIRNHHRNSLTPSSPSQCSSPTSSSNDEANIGGGYRANANDDFDEDDEELMFPFYDDLCSSRSSYPSSLSSSHHNRMRRSLYLDSTPYDWKQSATSSSSSTSSPPSSSSTSSSPSSSSSLPPTSTVAVTNAVETTAAAIATTSPAATNAGQSVKRATQASAPASSSSLGSSLDLSLSAASPDEQQQLREAQTTTSDSNDIYNKNSNNKFNDNRHTSERSFANKRAKGDPISTDDPEETQFKFEEDKPEMMAGEQQQPYVHLEQSELLDGKLEAGGSRLNAGIQQMGERTNTITTTNNLSSENITTTANNSNIKNAGSRDSKSNHSDKAKLQPPSNDETSDNNNERQTAANVSNVGILSRSNENSNSSISLDDEEFYDCYTDHDVSNMMIASDSISTLKVAE